MLPPNIEVDGVKVFEPKMLVSDAALTGTGDFSPVNDGADVVELIFPKTEVVVVVLATLLVVGDAVVVTTLVVEDEELGLVALALILDLPPKIGGVEAVLTAVGVVLPKILPVLPNAGVIDVLDELSVPKLSDDVELKIPPKL